MRKMKKIMTMIMRMMYSALKDLDIVFDNYTV